MRGRWATRFWTASFCLAALLGTVVLAWQIGVLNERGADASPERWQSRIRACNNPDRTATPDLCAQGAAAEAAEASAFWAMLSFLLGTAGTVGLLVTLYYTRASVRAANRSAEHTQQALRTSERSAEAAAQQLSLSKQTAQRQLRAYISTEQFRVEGMVVGAPLTLCMDYVNRGQTPAKRFMNKMTVFFAPGAERRPSVFFEHGFRRLGNIAPQQSSWSSYSFGTPLTQDICVKLIAGDLILVWAGIYTYRDVFGVKHRGTFRYKIAPVKLDDFGRGPLSKIQ
jgi:hypothetical protein